MKLPFIKFFPMDWLRDTRQLSHIARAVWIDILCLAWNEPERGIYNRREDMAAKELQIEICSGDCKDEDSDQVCEFHSVMGELSYICDVTLSNAEVTVISRRMKKYDSIRKHGAERQDRFRRNAKSNADVTGQTLDVRRQTLEVRKEKNIAPANNAVAPRPFSSGPSHSPKKGKTQPAKEPAPYWHELIAHIDASWTLRKGVPYGWDGREFARLRDLVRVYRAWGVMALWDLYMSTGGFWAKRTGYMISGLIEEKGLLLDDPKWKQLAKNYESKLEPVVRTDTQVLTALGITAKTI